MKGADGNMLTKAVVGERLTRERSHSEWSVAGDTRRNTVAEKKPGM